MGIFRQFPYSNFHEMNMDQILKITKDLENEWAQFQEDWDVDITNAVNAWLDAHPEATTTVIDGSLTLPKFSDTLKKQTVNYYVTPEMFGAVGDGVTDDTAAVRSALRKPYVRFDNIYKVTQQIEALSIDIAGNGKIITTDSFIICKNNVRIQDITIEQTADESSIAITCNKSAIIDNVTIKNGLGGLFFDQPYEYCEIKNCKLTNFYGNACFAIDIYNAGNTIIENNIVENISNNLDIDADGIKVWQPEDPDHPNVIIANNTLHNCRGRAIKASTANVEIRDNFIYNDDAYPTIGAFHAVDVQKGNSRIVGNTFINVPQGLHVSFRFYAAQHYIADNKFDGANEGFSKGGAMSFQSYTDEYACYVVVERSLIVNCPNLAITYAYGLHTYIFKDITHHGRSNNVSLGWRGTANQTTRIELYNCKCDYTWFFNIGGIIPNLYADKTEANCSESQTFLTTLPKTKYRAYFGEGITGGVGFRTIDIFSTSFLVELSTNSAHKIFNLSGQEVN